MSNRKTKSQQESKSARPPEYTIIRRGVSAPSGRAQPAQSNKTRQSKKFEETEARREQRREQRYQAKRRRQWLLALGIIVVFIAALAVALHFLTSRATGTPNPVATPSANASSLPLVHLAQLGSISSKVAIAS